MLSLLQGENYVMIANFVTALPVVRSARVRALGVTSVKRTTLAPDLPTVAESGLPGFELQQFYSLVAPAGTPGDIVQRWSRDMAQRFTGDDVKQRLAGEGVEIATASPADTAKLYAEQYAKWTKVIRDAGVKSD